MSSIARATVCAILLLLSGCGETVVKYVDGKRFDLSERESYKLQSLYPVGTRGAEEKLCRHWEGLMSRDVHSHRLAAYIAAKKQKHCKAWTLEMREAHKERERQLKAKPPEPTEGEKEKEAKRLARKVELEKTLREVAWHEINEGMCSRTSLEFYSDWIPSMNFAFEQLSHNLPHIYRIGWFSPIVTSDEETEVDFDDTSWIFSPGAETHLFVFHMLPDKLGIKVEANGLPIRTTSPVPVHILHRAGVRVDLEDELTLAPQVKSRAFVWGNQIPRVTVTGLGCVLVVAVGRIYL